MVYFKKSAIRIFSSDSFDIVFEVASSFWGIVRGNLEENLLEAASRIGSDEIQRFVLVQDDLVVNLGLNWEG
ncbi:MAG: hypothetical protein HY402_02280 [Elusimicrobia bacterium]|nr:hypothetical protein [Elusimicrobiota bacterium]